MGVTFLLVRSTWLPHREHLELDGIAINRPLRKKAFYANEENIFFVVELGAVSEFEHSDIRVEQPGTHDGGSGSIQVIEACHSRPR
jgi:hypothetical protein